MKARYSHSEWAEIVDEYRQGSVATALAKKYQVTFATIYYQLRKAGVKTRPKNHSRMKRVDIQELARLLDQKTMTIDQIAVHFQTSVPSIVRRMRKHGLHSVRGHGSPMENNFFWNGGKHRDKERYLLVKVPDHPYATKHGYVREHRLVVERILGRFLLPTEVVHHIDGDPQNNDPDNLEVFQTHADHMRHEWQENWYPQIEQLREKYRHKRRPQEKPSRPVSENDVAA